MRRLLVNSIEFSKNEFDERVIRVGFNSASPIFICIAGKFVKYRSLSVTGVSEQEKKLASLVYHACWNYLNGDEPESMDTEAMMHCEELAKKIDWKGLGFSKGEKGERELYLENCIAHYRAI